VLHARGCKVLSGDANDTAQALAIARQADVAVLCLGEERGMSGEASCRAEPDLPQAQADLARAVLALGKPVVLAISSGRPIILPKDIVDAVGAILSAWFLGTEAGNALGDILAGTRAPGGRLPVTWPYSAGQAPIYYARRRSGRPADTNQHYTSKYLDVPVEPLYPFGHGLSYTTFSVENLRLSAAEMSAADGVDVTVDLANTGARAGETVVFMFIQDPVASVTRPVLAAKAFAKVNLAAGERQTIRLRLAGSDMQFPGVDMRPRIENGRLDVLVGERAVESELLRASVIVTGGVDSLMA
jgi:beta-glucosidase